MSHSDFCSTIFSDYPSAKRSVSGSQVPQKSTCAGGGALFSHEGGVNFHSGVIFFVKAKGLYTIPQQRGGLNGPNSVPTKISSKKTDQIFLPFFKDFDQNFTPFSFIVPLPMEHFHTPGRIYQFFLIYEGFVPIVFPVQIFREEITSYIFPPPSSPPGHECHTESQNPRFDERRVQVCVRGQWGAIITFPRSCQRVPSN